VSRYSDEAIEEIVVVSCVRSSDITATVHKFIRQMSCSPRLRSTLAAPVN